MPKKQGIRNKATKPEAQFVATTFMGHLFYDGFAMTPTTFKQVGSVKGDKGKAIELARELGLKIKPADLLPV